jgi:hypothetical protein
MLGNTPRDIAIGARVPPPLPPDLLLDIHQALLDPGAEMRIAAD